MDMDGDDFIFVEEEFGQDQVRQEQPEVETNVEDTSWWSLVTENCHNGNAADNESDGGREESDLDSLCSDDEEDTVKKSKQEYNPQSNQENFVFRLGMEFPSVELLRHRLIEEFIKENREFEYVVNSIIKIRAKCKGKGCNWLLYAKVNNSDNKTVRINTLSDNHDCGIVFDNRLVTAPWLATHFFESFRLNPNMDYQSFRELVASTKFSDIGKTKFYRAKKIARDMLEGSVRDQYAILDDYCRELTSTSPGTTTLLKTSLVNGQRFFERVYICLSACKIGFNKGCRPLLGFDGCFLKGYCKGMLLAAIGLDANNSQFPVAWAVVEKENTSSWTWFLQLLREDLDIDNPSIFTMMSDRQKGLEKALGDIFPGAEIRFCVRHLHANFKKVHSGLLLKQLLWNCARATTVTEFTKRMNEVKVEDVKAYEWLLKKDAKEWSKSHFRVSVKCDMLINNLCESFNAAIMPARDKAIVTLLEKVRFWIMCRFSKKRLEVEKWKQPIGNRILEIIEKQKNISKYCQSTLAGNGKFQVTFLGVEQFVVDLRAKVCTCRRFQLSGVPRGHALSCIQVSGLQVMDYVDDWYKKAAHIASYSGGIVEPMTTPDKWPQVGLRPIIPPVEQTLPGRPKKKRNKSNDEPAPPSGYAKPKHPRTGQLNRCVNCNEPGHKRSTCPKPVAIKETTIKKKTGRPLKTNPTPETLQRRARKQKQKKNNDSQTRFSNQQKIE